MTLIPPQLMPVNKDTTLSFVRAFVDSPIFNKYGVQAIKLCESHSKKASRKNNKGVKLTSGWLAEKLKRLIHICKNFLLSRFQLKPGGIAPVEYEATLLQVLERVSQGYSQSNLTELWEKLNSQEEFNSWLQNWGERCLRRSKPQYELARRMILLAEVEFGKTGWILLDLGRQLLALDYKVNLEVISNHSADLCEVGLQQIYVGDYNSAKNCFERAIKLDPLNPDLWFRIGFTCYLLGDYENALKNLKSALELKTEDTMSLALAFCGWSYLKLGQLEEAKRNFELANNFYEVQPNSDNYKDWQGRCIALHGLFSLDGVSRLEEALKSYQKAVSLKSDSCEIWLSSGIVLADLGNNDVAIACYDKALEIQPNYHEVWRRRGIAVSRRFSWEQAVISLSTAACISPNTHKSWHRLGITLSHMGWHQNAIMCFDKALSSKETFAEAWYGRGNALVRSDLPDKYCQAIESFETAIRYKPTYAEAWFQLGFAQEHNSKDIERYQKALASYQQAVNYNPERAETWHRRGFALARLHRLPEAIQSYDQAIFLQPAHEKAWVERERVLSSLFQRRKYADVKRSCERILRIQEKRTDPDTHKKLADTLIQLDSKKYLDTALKHYNSALKFGGDKDSDWQASTWLGKALGKAKLLARALETQNRQEAFRQYQEALRAFEKARGFNSLLWEAYDQEGWMRYQFNRRKPQTTVWQQGIRALKQIETANRDEEGLGELFYSQGRLFKNFRYWLDAKRSFKAAIEHLRAAQLLKREVEVWQELLEVYQHLEETEKYREELRAVQIEGTERFEELLKSRENDAIRLSKEFASFNQLSVDTYIRLGEIDTALEVAEKRKNLCLSWFYKHKRRSKSWSYEEIQQELLDDNTIAIDWHISPTSITMFILTHDHQPTAYQTSFQKFQRFQHWVNRWKKLYRQQQNHTWRNELPEMVSQLFKILDLSYIIKIIEEKEVEQIILIPHRDLHLLPLHIFFCPPYTSRVFSLTYLPSSQTGIELRRQHHKFSECLLEPSLLSVRPISQKKRGVGIRRDQLLYAKMEAEIIHQLFSSINLMKIKEGDAKREQVFSNLKKNNHFFHFTGHAYHDIDEPRRSALALSDGQLAIQAIFDEFSKSNLSSYYVVSLSACETGIAGKSGLNDEFVSLASCFIALGTAYVVSSLWKVREDSAALLMIQFYRNIKQGDFPPLALQKAQYWLKNLSYSSLAEWYSMLAEEFDQLDIESSTRLKNLAELSRDIEAARINFREAIYDFVNSYQNVNSSSSDSTFSTNLKIFRESQQHISTIFSCFKNEDIVMLEKDVIIPESPYATLDLWAAFTITGSFKC